MNREFPVYYLSRREMELVRGFKAQIASSYMERGDCPYYDGGVVGQIGIVGAINAIRAFNCYTGPYYDIRGLGGFRNGCRPKK